MRRSIWLLAAIIVLNGCNKKTTTPAKTDNNDSTSTIDSAVTGIMNYVPVTDVPHFEEVTGPYQGFTAYLIKKGNNYCEGNTYPTGIYGDISFKAILDSSCIYTNVDPNNQADINKLYGYSDCSSYHHTNSARFGWNWDKGAMHIHAYCYKDSVRSYKELGTVEVNKAFDCSLKLLPGKYVFMLNGKSDTMDRGCSGNTATGYLLYPYFGGDEPAPQDITVRIKEIK